eukprot:SAG31_NODE_2751_length_5144_cov_2.392666_1_plen_39_part_10
MYLAGSMADSVQSIPAVPVGTAYSHRYIVVHVHVGIPTR